MAALAAWLVAGTCAVAQVEPPPDPPTTPPSYIYAASLATVRIDPVTGVPSSVAAPPAASQATRVAAEPRGTHLYVVTSDWGNAEVLAYALDPASGMVSAQPFSRAPLPMRTFALAIAPGGRMLTTFQWREDPVLAPCEGPGLAQMFALTPKGAFMARGTATTGVATSGAGFTPICATCTLPIRAMTTNSMDPAPAAASTATRSTR